MGLRLSYDKLAADYVDSLHSKLRNFAVEPEFLGMWVHDEDDHKSIFEIFSAAKDSGAPELTLEIGRETAKRLKLESLGKELSRLGTYSERQTGDALELLLRFAPESSKESPATKPRVVETPTAGKNLSPVTGKACVNGSSKANRTFCAPKPGEIHPVYQEALRRAAERIVFEGPLPPPAENSILVAAEEGGARLEALVDPQGIVRAAGHSNASGTLKTLLDQLCALMLDRPLLEARDHGAIRLESKLRDHSMPPPVLGVSTPNNVGDLFTAPQRLVRRLFDIHLDRTHGQWTPNFWDDAPAKAWSALTPEARIARASAGLQKASRELGVPLEGLEVLEILNDVRLVLAHTPLTAQTGFGIQMLRLEAGLKRELDPRIELQLESLEDANRRAQRTARSNKLV